MIYTRFWIALDDVVQCKGMRIDGLTEWEQMKLMNCHHGTLNSWFVEVEGHYGESQEWEYQLLAYHCMSLWKQSGRTSRSMLETAHVGEPTQKKNKKLFEYPSIKCWLTPLVTHQGRFLPKDVHVPLPAKEQNGLWEEARLLRVADAWLIGCFVSCG